ncbi:AMP-binding protein [Chloroflexota bacterium]
MNGERSKATSKEYVLRELCRYKIGTYADIIYRNSLLYPDREAFVYGPQRVTFAEYNGRVNSLIHALESVGVKKDDVIGILSWNCLDYVDVYGAAMKGGFIASPYNPRLQASELDYLVNYSEANTIFVGTELVEIVASLRPRLPGVKHFISFEGPAPNMIAHSDLLATHSQEEPDIQVEEDDPLAIIYTSGTTGVPRGALYTQSHLLDDTKTLAVVMGLQPGDRHIQIMPLFHIGGLSHLRAFFYVGGTSIIMPQRSFDPAVTLQTIHDEKATHIDIVATHLIAMLALPDLDKYDLSNLKRMWYAASPMPVEVLKKGIKGYGQTESGPAITDLTKEDHDVLDRPPEEQRVLASAGRPSIGVHVRIVDDKDNDVRPGEVGEIITRSKHNMVEFWRKPEETKEAVVREWLHTGDMGTYDEKGYIYIVDRKRDTIVSGGENVYPREVEEVLYRHPAIQEVAVIGIPDPYWVERVHAVAVLKEEASLTADELIAFCKKNLAGYKAPKSVEYVTSLPKNPAGKSLKKELREKYWKDRGKEV